MADRFSTSKLRKIPPQSCDTFAALPPATLDDCIIFGKNSDRPAEEVQEVVYFPAQEYPEASKLKCTYIEIDQAPFTYAVILSKPAWMWGAEMGANEHGVCIGNEAVWTRVPDEDSSPKLLGMDLLRLALERSKTAPEALKVIVSLLEAHGMGGNCSDTLKNFDYHNSFLIADPSEVWILECAGKIWAAEKVTEGVRNISNQLTIHTKIDLSCSQLETFAQKGGYWHPSDGPLDFQLAFAEDDMDTLRYKVGRQLLSTLSEQGTFSAVDMFKILRDKNSTICMTNSNFVTTSSQVSVLRKTESGYKCCHWFTGTLDPSTSVFKPFFFCKEVSFPEEIVSPVPDPDSEETDRKHRLYKLHEDVWTRLRRYDDLMCRQLNDLEEKYLSLASEMAAISADENLAKDLFRKAVEEECLLLI